MATRRTEHRNLTRDQAEKLLATAKERIPDHGLTGNARRLLVLLADEYVNRDTRECWPSLDRMAKATGSHMATVCRSLAILERLGLLVVVKRSKGGTRRRKAQPQRSGITTTYRMPTLEEYRATLDQRELSQNATVELSQKTSASGSELSHFATPELSHSANSNSRKMRDEPGSSTPVGSTPVSPGTPEGISGFEPRASREGASGTRNPVVDTYVSTSAHHASRDDALPFQRTVSGWPGADATLFAHIGLGPHDPPRTDPPNLPDSLPNATSQILRDFEMVWSEWPSLSRDQVAWIEKHAADLSADQIRSGLLICCWHDDKRLTAALAVAAVLRDQGIDLSTVEISGWCSATFGLREPVVFQWVGWLDRIRRDDLTTDPRGFGSTANLWDTVQASDMLAPAEDAWPLSDDRETTTTTTPAQSAPATTTTPATPSMAP